MAYRLTSWRQDPDGTVRIVLEGKDDARRCGFWRSFNSDGLGNSTSASHFDNVQPPTPESLQLAAGADVG